MLRKLFTLPLSYGIIMIINKKIFQDGGNVMKKLIKVDKNGTKYYSHGCACSRCGGQGGSDAWLYTGWTCYQCGGSGIGPEIISKEYTPEYAAKLEARRTKRAEAKKAELAAKADETNKEFFQAQGFNEFGKTYVILGNTYNVKDQLKELGCKWSNLIGWHSPNELEGFDSVEIDVDDVYHKDYVNTYRWNSWKGDNEETYSAKIKEANEKLNRETSTSKHVGDIGDKVEMEVELIRRGSFESEYGTTYVYNFKDSEGNIIIWKTKNYFEVTTCIVKGTVKEHSEYKGVPQTVLTRCKVN